MRKLKLIAVIISFALTGAFLFSACGGADDEGDASGESAAAEGAAEEPTEGTEAAVEEEARDEPMAGESAEHGSMPSSESSQAALARDVTVRLGEWFFKANRKKLRAGQVTVKIRNVGDIEHDLVMVKTDVAADEMPMTHDGAPDVDKAGHVVLGGHDEGGHGSMGGDDIHVMPGEMERVTVKLKPGKYVLVCSYQGHYQAGQGTSLTVVG